MTDQTEDRFKGTGQFHPDKAWAEIQKKDWERKISTPRPPPLPTSKRAGPSQFWLYVRYAGYALGALIALLAALAFHAVFPKALPALGTAILWFGGIYVVTCIVTTNKKIDALHAELKDLRYDLNDLKSRL